LTPVISAKPEAATVENITNGPSPQQTPKQPGPTQASPSEASPSSSPKQPVTPVISTRLITAARENTANTLSTQQNPKQPSPTQETHIALVVKPESTSTDKSESSGTNKSERGVVTRQKADTKGKELKEVNEAKCPEAKAKLLRAKACQKKEKEQQDAIGANNKMLSVRMNKTGTKLSQMIVLNPSRPMLILKSDLLLLPSKPRHRSPLP